MLSQHQRRRNIEASYLYLQVPRDTRELGDVFYKKIGFLYTRYKDWPKQVQSVSPGLLSSHYRSMLCILTVSRFLEKPECAENLSMCQGKAPCAVFLNVEELIESPKKLLVRQKTNTISTNKEEKSTKEAGSVSQVDAVNKSPKASQAEMANDPVRKVLLGDIEKEANSKDTESQNKNTQIS
jgi:hypothetical protein